MSIAVAFILLVLYSGVMYGWGYANGKEDQKKEYGKLITKKKEAENEAVDAYNNK